MTAGLDLLIVPGFITPAVPFSACSDLSPVAFATGLFNVRRIFGGMRTLTSQINFSFLDA
jgi:hypothetical protein